jgi:hypothetical protein
MSQNKISAALAASAVTNITTAIATIRTNAPFLINLTPSERHGLPNVTEGSQGVVLAALNFVAQHPEALPGTFDTVEFNKDGTLLPQLQQVASQIAQLNEDFNDTLRALHSDLYVAFLDVYAFAQANNRTGAYNGFIDSVKGRFARPSRKKSSPTPPTA